MRSWLVAAALVGPLVLVGAPAARASEVVQYSREELTRRSDVVVEGAVVARRSTWDPAHRFILTYSTVAVRSYWKGAGAATITVAQLGGTVGRDTGILAGEALLEVGQQVVLFLEAQGGAFILTGGPQSVYLVDPATPPHALTASRDLTGASLVVRTADGTRVEHGALEREPLDRLRSSVAAYTTRGAP